MSSLNKENKEGRDENKKELDNELTKREAEKKDCKMDERWSILKKLMYEEREFSEWGT